MNFCNAAIGVVGAAGSKAALGGIGYLAVCIPSYFRTRNTEAGVITYAARGLHSPEVVPFLPTHNFGRIFNLSFT